MDEYGKDLSSSSKFIIQMGFQKAHNNILYRARMNLICGKRTQMSGAPPAYNYSQQKMIPGI